VGAKQIKKSEEELDNSFQLIRINPCGGGPASAGQAMESKP